MSAVHFTRMTPWVWRLIVVNAVVLLLLMTLLPALAPRLVFRPGHVWGAPWTFLTYMFVHAGPVHLALNMLLLFFLGPPVEHRLSSRVFIRFYLFCGLGGALLSLGLASLTVVAPFAGASGAVLGIAVAFALFWPDAELMVFPIPVPIKAKTLIIGLVVLDLVLATIGRADGIAHWAHLGGALFGYAFFRAQTLFQQRPTPTPTPPERVLVAKPDEFAAEAHGPPPAPRPRKRAQDPVTAELDRVLDKISAEGMNSLTVEERRFLSDIAQRKKDEPLA